MTYPVAQQPSVSRLSQKFIPLVPRLRRLGCMLLADQARADAALLHALQAARNVDSYVRDADELAVVLFSMAARAFEREARSVSRVIVFPLRPIQMRRQQRDGRPLLGRYWSLPYEQRIALALSAVEDFSISDAARIARMSVDTFSRHLSAGTRALGADG